MYTWDHKSSGAFWAGMKVLVLMLFFFRRGKPYIGSGQQDSGVKACGIIGRVLWKYLADTITDNLSWQMRSRHSRR